MDNNDLSLTELKAQAQSTSVGGQKIEADVGSTVGGSWMDRVTSDAAAPTPITTNNTVKPTPTGDTGPMYITDAAPVAKFTSEPVPDLMDGKPIFTREPVAITKSAIGFTDGGNESDYNKPSTSLPQLPAEEYDGPGIVMNPDDLVEKVTPMITAGAPAGLDDTLNAYMADMDNRIEEAKTVYEEKAKAVEATKEEETADIDPEEFNKKYNEAIVVIDKTSMGKIINFTDAERQKLDYAKKITVQEIESTTMKVLKTKKPVSGKNSFKIDSIIERRQSLHSTNIVLTASGYTATMKGCTPYELMEIINENKNDVINQEIRWGLIYRKIETTSIGKMSFNQFLERTAVTDYQIFLFGILCATYPDDDKFPLTCQTEGCGKQFDHHYSVKSLIRAEKMSDKLKIKFANIVDSSHTTEDAIKTHCESPVMQMKRIELPLSGYIMDISIQSGYDFIYKSIKELTKDQREEKYQQAAITSSMVRKLYIKDGEGEDAEYFEFDQPFDITKAVYSLDAIDLKILYKQAELLFADTSFEFGLMNVCCPHCRTVTNTVPVDVENVLFYRYHQELSTTIG